MKNTRKNLTVLAIVIVCVVIIVAIVTHKSCKEAVNDMLSDFSGEYQDAIVEEYPDELPMDEFWDNEKLQNRLNDITIRHAEKLSALGEGAVEAIARHAKKNAILYTHLSAWHRGHPGLESIREEMLQQEYALAFFEDPWHEIISSGRLFVCFTALEKIGKPASASLESMLSGEWTGFPAAITLAIIREEEILRKHFEDAKATEIERLNSATGLAFLKDKTVLSFLIKALSASKSSESLKVELAIFWLGKEAVSEVRKKYEEGSISRNAFIALTLLRNARIDYSNHLRITRFYMEEDEASEGFQKPLGGLTFKADQIPEKELGEFFSETKKQRGEICIEAEIGYKVKYEYFEKFLSLCEKQGIYGIFITSLVEPGTLWFSKKILIRIYEPSEEPTLTSQMLVFKLQKKGLDRNTIAAIIKNKHFEFEIPSEALRTASWGKLYHFLVIARDNFRPTKSFKTLPIVADPASDLTMDAVMEFLMICCDANLEDINFAHHTRYCDWVVELDKYLESKREQEKQKQE